MEKNYIIAPSILAADFARLGEDCQKVIDAGANWLHFDVMDNHYVPNLTVGPQVLKSLRDFGIKVPIDVHLMIEPVDDIIPSFVKAGASCITFHPEATYHINRTIKLIKGLGCKVGLAFNPATPLDYLDYVLDELDLILIMSVNPGFGGQKFIDSVLAKIKQAKDIITKSKKRIHLEVDGGITVENISKIAQMGADTFVAGSTIFTSDNYNKTIQLMRDNLIKL